MIGRWEGSKAEGTAAAHAWGLALLVSVECGRGGGTELGILQSRVQVLRAAVCCDSKAARAGNGVTNPE